MPTERELTQSDGQLEARLRRRAHDRLAPMESGTLKEVVREVVSCSVADLVGVIEGLIERVLSTGDFATIIKGTVSSVLQRDIDEMLASSAQTFHFRKWEEVEGQVRDIREVLEASQKSWEEVAGRTATAKPSGDTTERLSAELGSVRERLEWALQEFISPQSAEVRGCLDGLEGRVEEVREELQWYASKQADAVRGEIAPLSQDLKGLKRAVEVLNKQFAKLSSHQAHENAAQAKTSRRRQGPDSHQSSQYTDCGSPHRIAAHESQRADSPPLTSGAEHDSHLTDVWAGSPKSVPAEILPAMEYRAARAKQRSSTSVYSHRGDADAAQDAGGGASQRVAGREREVSSELKREVLSLGARLDENEARAESLREELQRTFLQKVGLLEERTARLETRIEDLATMETRTSSSGVKHSLRKLGSRHNGTRSNTDSTNSLEFSRITAQFGEQLEAAEGRRRRKHSDVSTGVSSSVAADKDWRKATTPGGVAASSSGGVVAGISEEAVALLGRDSVDCITGQGSNTAHGNSTDSLGTAVGAPAPAGGGVAWNPLQPSHWWLGPAEVADGYLRNSPKSALSGTITSCGSGVPPEAPKQRLPPMQRPQDTQTPKSRHHTETEVQDHYHGRLADLPVSTWPAKH